eukprot:CAMPEP_0167747768 /NCGR_PEP_ID=MMETSP0110_2-20121227/4464_1 /TAXON_ID=629695 /ORGANISM="Gymnochlora sp., Strain CCMP2014" /LENGTH=178 /DNA_ID=CAMNT_0007632705 /DNA_START=108 /DNA_END=641 /DNA_ORIENTATION=+
MEYCCSLDAKITRNLLRSWEWIGPGLYISEAILLHDFRKVIGIEILEDVLKISQKATKNFQEEAKFWNEKKLNIFPTEIDIEMRHGDMLVEDWSDGDVVFINAGNYESKFMYEIRALAEDLAPGSLIISTTHTLVSDKLELLSSRQLSTGHGYMTFHVQRRRKLKSAPSSRPMTASSS